jgi:hypothetical protein
MSPTIVLSDGLYRRLQSHAEPFTDSPESVIARAIDALEAGLRGPLPPVGGPREFNPASPPNLSFTTPKTITLCGVTFKKGETYWNPLMFACIREAAKTGLTPNEIGELIVVPFVSGKKDDNGYVFIADAGVSVQGQTANGAWKQAHHIALKLGLSVSVEFTWQNNDKAAMPNVTGVFNVA